VLEAQVYYYHNDLLGSPICVTDIDGNVAWKGDYLPFGEPLQDIDTVYWGNAYTYLGNEDDGGLMYFNARYYAKELGRFMSCDPIKDMASSGLTINPYAYCANNPLVFTDPTGLRMAGKARDPDINETQGNMNRHWIQGWSIYSQGAYQGISLTNMAFTQIDALIDSIGLNEETHQTVFMKDSYGLKPSEEKAFQEVIEYMTHTSVEWVDETRAEMEIDEAHQVHGEILGSAHQAFTRGFKLGSAKELISEGGMSACGDEYAGSKSFFLFWPMIRSRAKQGWTDYWKQMGMPSGWFTGGPKNDVVGHVGAAIAMHEIGHIVLNQREHLIGEEKHSYMWDGWFQDPLKMYKFAHVEWKQWSEGWIEYGEAGRYWDFFNPDY
jgi:RHS repeat-associated protein